MAYSESNQNMKQSDKVQPDQQDAVFGALYDFVRERASASQMDMILPKDAFVLNTRLHPNCVDASRFAGMAVTSLILSVFWSLLNRVPDRQTLKTWEEASFRKTAVRFKNKLFRRLSHSLEARTKRVMSVTKSFDGIDRIDCFQDINRKAGLPGRVRFVIAFYVTDKVLSFLYDIYKKTLRPVRMHFRERRIAGRISKNGSGGQR